ncbi:MAG TPA: hypothetical protein VIN05_04385 [Roseovarius sp.]
MVLSVVLTGGMAEHIPELRARLVGELDWLGAVLDKAANGKGRPILTAPGSRLPVLMLPTDEEQVLARHAYDALTDG